MIVLLKDGFARDTACALATFDKALSSKDFVDIWKKACEVAPDVEEALTVLLEAGQWLVQYGSLTPQNSSLPPSTLQIGKKKEPEPQDSNSQDTETQELEGQEQDKTSRPKKRKPGGQPGHKGTNLAFFKNPDETVPIRPEGLPPGRAYEYITVTSRQVVSVQLVRKVTQYDYQMAVDPSTGAIYPHPPIQPNHARAVQYDNSAKALLAYMHVMQCLPYKRTVLFLSHLGGIEISQGTLFNSLKLVEKKLLKLEVDKIIKANLLAQPVLHVDETFISVNKDNAFIHVLAGGEWCFQHASMYRGKIAHEEGGILPNYLYTLVHDCLIVYFGYDCEHALCHPHIIRELKKVYDTSPYKWPELFEDFFNLYHDLVEEAGGCLSAEKCKKAEWHFKCLCTRARNQMTNGLPLDHEKVKPLRKRYPKAFSLLERLIKHREPLLLWMKRPEVPYSNNVVERDGRMFKVHGKVSNCFRKIEHARTYCLIRSFLMTCQKHGITDSLKVLADLLNDKLPDFMKYPDVIDVEASDRPMSTAAALDEGAVVEAAAESNVPVAAGAAMGDTRAATTTVDGQLKALPATSPEQPPPEPPDRLWLDPSQPPPSPSVLPAACS